MKDGLNLIKEIFQERHRKNPGYSLRAFARDAGVSASQISRLLNGTRTLSADQFSLIAAHLGISERKKRAIEADPIKGRVLPGTKALNRDVFKSVAEWQHWAILNLTFVDGFESAPAWIAKRLGISIHVAKESIERLLELGLLERINDALVKTNPNQIIQTRRSEESIRLYHQQMIAKASEELKDPSQAAYSKRAITGQTFAISKPALKRIQKKLDGIRAEIAEIVSSDRDRSEVYQLNLQLFPLSKNPKPLKQSGEIK